MKYIHIRDLNNNDIEKPTDIREQLYRLLQKEDASFVPPLSRRQSTTQLFCSGTDQGTTIDAYFNELITQDFIFAIDDDDTLAGFISFKPNFHCPELAVKECLYVSTVIVDERFRGVRLTYDLYAELFLIAMGSNLPIVTRTWHTNHRHIRVLKQSGFSDVRTISNDRGDGINTVYYMRRFNADDIPLFQRLKAYRVFSSLVVSALLLLFAAVFVILFIYASDTSEVASELSLAFATSLLVSAVCLVIDTSSQYKKTQNDRYLADMKSFGIERLTFDKQTFLLNRINQSEKVIWVSGYKHILTSSIAVSLKRAEERNVSIRILTSASWLPGYEIVYGMGDSVVLNYIKVFRSVLSANIREASNDLRLPCEIRFTSKVLFNDIYRVDDCFITSPFYYATPDSSCEDSQYATARDFFTVVVSSDSKLWKATENEYLLLWDSAEYQLDAEKFLDSFKDSSYFREDKKRKRTNEENLELLRACLISRGEQD